MTDEIGDATGGGNDRTSEFRVTGNDATGAASDRTSEFRVPGGDARAASDADARDRSSARLGGDARLSTRRVFTGRVINLDVDTVRYPNGTTGELEMIRHPGASAIVPFLTDPEAPDPQILLIKQYRYAADGFLYEIPAGRLEANEPPEQCAHRELLEETGCTASKMSFMTTMFTTPGFTDERIHLYLASGLTRGETKREADEFMEVETMPLARAIEMVGKGEIKDAKTALALLFAAGFRLGM